jgi:LicD family
MKTKKLIALSVLMGSFLFISFSYAREHTKYFREYTDHFNIRLMPAERVGKFYQQLKIMDKIFNENGIPYWITFGTLLGAIRNGGMIPWDKDADVEIFKDDSEKAMRLNHLFREFGCEISRWISLEGENVGLRISSPGSNMHPIDIFFSKNVREKIVFTSEWALKDFPNSYWFEHELFPLKRISFGPIELNIAINPLPHIFRHYGNDALTHAVIGNFKFTINDFNSAPYVMPE